MHLYHSCPCCSCSGQVSGGCHYHCSNQNCKNDPCFRPCTGLVPKISRIASHFHLVYTAGPSLCHPFPGSPAIFRRLHAASKQITSNNQLLTEFIQWWVRSNCCANQLRCLWPSCRLEAVAAYHGMFHPRNVKNTETNTPLNWTDSRSVTQKKTSNSWTRRKSNAPYPHSPTCGIQLIEATTASFRRGLRNQMNQQIEIGRFGLAWLG